MAAPEETVLWHLLCQLQKIQDSFPLNGKPHCQYNFFVLPASVFLPGPRAWISVSYEEHWAEMVVKNVSAMELDADTSQLTERFTRGDKARNTEGSGLGLAIVKSFAQLQGGSFEIVVDGDLFKAIVRLPKESPKE